VDDRELEVAAAHLLSYLDGCTLDEALTRLRDESEAGQWARAHLLDTARALQGTPLAHLLRPPAA
jgi:hypothetical protein